MPTRETKSPLTVGETVRDIQSYVLNQVENARADGQQNTLAVLQDLQRYLVRFRYEERYDASTVTVDGIVSLLLSQAYAAHSDYTKKGVRVTQPRDTVLVVVDLTTSTASLRVAAEIQEFLKSQGLTAKRTGVGMEVTA